MKFSVSREELLRPLQKVVNVIERRQTLPVLSNVLVDVSEQGLLSLTATDLEIELHDDLYVNVTTPGRTTIPGRKLHDICRNLPEGVEISLAQKDAKIQVKAGKSQFSLATLPAAEFPELDDIKGGQKFNLPQAAVRKAIQKTQFSMGVQDVRYYLNGLLFELTPTLMRMVSTDGHRLSLSSVEVALPITEKLQAIVPRKGVAELVRIMDLDSDEVQVQMTANHIRFHIGSTRFTSKLIDGKFPDYNRVLPSGNTNIAMIDREELKQALSRVAILSNEKYRGVRLLFSENQLVMQTDNPDQEKAEESIEIEFPAVDIEIGFNVSYVLEVLNALEGELVKFHLKDSSSSCLVTESESEVSEYVVMPMRL